MPALQTEVLDPRKYRLRHVGLAADLYPQGGAPTATTVLGKAFVPRELPVSHLTNSPDFVTGQYTGRLGDAGEFVLTFPNAVASDGYPWRSRFKTDGHNQFVEVYRDDVLEFVGVILKVSIDLGKVEISGQDGFFLLRKQYERDQPLVMAPRDVVERYSAVRTSVLTDNFPGSSLDATKWNNSGTGVVTVARNRCEINTSFAAGRQVTAIATLTAGQPFRVSALVVPSILIVTSGTDRGWVGLAIARATPNPVPGATSYYAQLGWELTQPTGLADTFGDFFQTTVGTVVHKSVRPSTLASNVNAASSPDWRSLEIVYDGGRWAYGYIDGVLVGVLPYASTGSHYVSLEANVYVGGPVEKITVSQVVARTQSPFLMRGATKGDYALPGSSGTYPYGGLHGRYWNELDLISESSVPQDRMVSPVRVAYAERLDATINNPTPPQPGAATTNLWWSSRWFGAVWLPLATVGGTWTFTISNLDDGARLWVGKTQWGNQIIDDWGGGGARTDTGTITAAALGARDAWYPIILDYFQAAGGQGIVLSFTPPGAGTYVDPGGSTITRGGSVLIPLTSLSPLGCVDQRYQGQSFFDIVQKAAVDYGYQITCAPMQLESGEFPGRIAPVIRQGRDTDEILDVEDLSTGGAAPIFSPTNVLDATDQVAAMVGHGAGIADGKGSQILAETYDLTSVNADLFALEGMVDSSDVTFGALLRARVAAQLALQLSPWQNVSGDPRGIDRLADTFPLTGSLAAFRWQPGDGVRIRVPAIGVEDASPRQMLQVTRTFGPEGRTRTSAGFRQRPKDPEAVLRQQARAAIVGQRSYQRQYVTASSLYQVDGSIVAGGFGAQNNVVVRTGDKLVGASLVVSAVYGGNSVPLDIELNAVLRGSSLGGPWTWPNAASMMVSIDITAFALDNAGGANIYARWKNVGGVASPTIEWQIVATFLR